MTMAVVVSNSGSPSVSLSDDLKGHRAVINVPSAHLSECIQYEPKCKAYTSASTSACVVPEHLQRPLEQQSHGMTVLHEHQEGEVLCTVDALSDS